MRKFNELREKYFEKLELYVPVVARVHGKAHPEFYDVQELYNRISEKIKNTRSQKLELSEEFKELRRVTNNYTIPEDTCESYEAVYNMLFELDKNYNG